MKRKVQHIDCIGEIVSQSNVGVEHRSALFNKY